MEESSKAIGTMKRLLRRQLSFLLEKIEKWNFDSFCQEVCPDINIVTKYCPASGIHGNCAHTRSAAYSCNTHFSKAHGEYSRIQFQCSTSRPVFEGKWKVPEMSRGRIYLHTIGSQSCIPLRWFGIKVGLLKISV